MLKRECNAEHKADGNHLEVGAASIIAKLLDRIIEELSNEIGIDLGSAILRPKTKAAVVELTKEIASRMFALVLEDCA